MIKWIQAQALWILGLALLVAIAAFGTQSLRLKWAHADLAQSAVDLKAAREANVLFATQNDALVKASGLEATARTELQDALKAETGKRHEVERINRDAVADLKAARAAAAASAAKLKQTLESQYANDPEALAWSRGVVPRVVSDGVRVAWAKAQGAGANRGEAGGGARAGDEAGRAEPRADEQAATRDVAAAGIGLPGWLLHERPAERSVAYGAGQADRGLRRH